MKPFSIALALGLAAAAAGTASANDVAVRYADLDLADAQGQAEEALTGLRHVVRGIHPPILTDRGLEGAVRALAGSSALGVTVRTDGLPDGPRAPAAVEAAAYFVIAEALTNVAKYAGATHARVDVRRAGAELVVEVQDDGSGGARLGGGSGLRGLADRVGALDGSLELDSAPAAGTLVRARIPVRSAPDEGEHG